ncbi:potassium channel family protein [Streptomyces physcomitrii]|uniref:potassium channel family protein n=1 Tax=Streptomyces physcomitrii TaxID=2724184 RepID=UPI00344785A5
MQPGIFNRMLGLFLGGEHRSLHLKAAGTATLSLLVTVFVSSWAVVAAEEGASGANITDYPKALWWAVETATTVGYGDLYPVTLWGRIVALVVMGVGITTFGMVTAALATWFVGHEQRRARLLHKAEHEARRLAQDAAGDAEDTVRSLHRRFDRLEEALAGGQGGSGPQDG